MPGDVIQTLEDEMQSKDVVQSVIWHKWVRQRDDKGEASGSTR